MSNLQFFRCLAILFLISSVSCATNIKKSSMAVNADPNDEIAALERDISQAEEEHVNILAAKDYESAWDRFREAKEDQADQEEAQEILNEVAYSRAYLARANELAAQRRPQVERILAARTAALKAGVKRNQEFSRAFHRLDEKIVENADDLKGNLSSQDYAKLQSDYLGLELASLQDKYLATSRLLIQDSKNKEKASRRAPVSLKKAEMDLAAAENAIAINRYDTPSFSTEVITANTSAQMLREVLSQMNSNKSIDERAAIQLVQQDQKISRLRGTLGAAETDMAQMSGRIKKQNQRLTSAQAKLTLQQTMEKARKSFSKDEAEVFQQGNSLVVRLKQMAFKSGSAALPPSSFPLLTKVDAVIADLNSKEVIVEGHTDAVGPQKANQTLSQNRAETVAQYIRENGSGGYSVTAKGEGFARPIATNKSAQGRAQNRRVDVIVKAAPVEQSPSRLSEL